MNTFSKKNILKEYTCIYCKGSGIIFDPEKEACTSCGGENEYSYKEKDGKLKEVKISKIKKGAGKVSFLQEIWLSKEYLLEAGLYQEENSKETFWGVEVNKVITVSEKNKKNYPFTPVGEKAYIHLYKFDTNSKDLVYAYKKSKEKLEKSLSKNFN